LPCANGSQVNNAFNARCPCPARLLPPLPGLPRFQPPTVAVTLTFVPLPAFVALVPVYVIATLAAHTWFLHTPYVAVVLGCTGHTAPFCLAHSCTHLPHAPHLLVPHTPHLFPRPLCPTHTHVTHIHRLYCLPHTYLYLVCLGSCSGYAFGRGLRFTYMPFTPRCLVCIAHGCLHCSCPVAVGYMPLDLGYPFVTHSRTHRAHARLCSTRVWLRHGPYRLFDGCPFGCGCLLQHAHVLATLYHVCLGLHYLVAFPFGSCWVYGCMLLCQLVTLWFADAFAGYCCLPLRCWIMPVPSSCTLVGLL